MTDNEIKKLKKVEFRRTVLERLDKLEQSVSRLDAYVDVQEELERSKEHKDQEEHKE